VTDLISDERPIEDVAGLLRRVIRVGTVAETIPAEAQVEVEFRDAGTDGLRSYRCAVLQASAREDQYYAMPDEGDRVVVLSLPMAEEIGFVVGSFYNADDRPPASSQDKDRIEFNDGGVVEYDRSSGRLRVNTEGDLSISVAGDATVDIEGDAVVEAARTMTVRGENGVDIDGGGGATGKALVFPRAISDFTGKPVQPGSSTIDASV